MYSWWGLINMIKKIMFFLEWRVILYSNGNLRFVRRKVDFGEY